MITLILTQLAGGRTFDPKNPRQVAELAKRDLRLAVPTAFAATIDVDGRPVVIACVGSEGDSRAETGFGNWFAQTPEDSVCPALERNNVAAVITSAGLPADPAAMFGSVLELHTPDASIDKQASFGDLVADALQDQLRQVGVLASQTVGTVNNAHGDSILTVVSSSTQEKASEMTNVQINYSALLETIRNAAAKVQAMSGSKVEGFFADEQSLGKLINIASRTGALDAASADAIRGDLSTFVDLLAFQPSSVEEKSAVVTAASVEDEIPVLEEVEEQEEVEEVEEVEETFEGADEDQEDDEDDDFITGFENVDAFINAASSGEVMTDSAGQDMDEDDLTSISASVRDALSQLVNKFPDLGTEFNDDDIEAADFEELASMLYTALTVVTESDDSADQESVFDIMAELDNAIEDVVNAQLEQGDDNEDGVDYTEEVIGSHDHVEDDVETEETEETEDTDLELVSVEIHPRMVIALTTDIDQSVYGTETVAAVRSVESTDGSINYNLALGINGTGVRRTEADGYFRTPLIDTAKMLGKLPSGLIMLPRSVVENTDAEQLVSAITNVVGGSFDSLFADAVFGDTRLPIDEDGVLALGFEEEGEEQAVTDQAAIDLTDLVSYSVSADPSVDDAGNQVIDLNVFITLRLIGIRHLSKKDRIVARLCKLAQSMSVSGVEVVPAFVYNASKAMYGSEVEREEIATLQKAFDDVAAESETWVAVGVISSAAVEGNLSGTGIISGGELVELDSGLEIEDSEAYLASELMDIVNSNSVGTMFELGGNIAVVLLQGSDVEADDEAEEE